MTQTDSANSVRPPLEGADERAQNETTLLPIQGGDVLREPNDAARDAAHCIVDRNGQIIAADPIVEALATRRRENAGSTPRTLEQLIGAADAARALASLHSGGRLGEIVCAASQQSLASGAPVKIRLKRLDGPGGPLLLVEAPQEGVPSATAGGDPLTRLPDRRAIAERADQWRRAAAPEAPRFAVLFLDLVDFKAVNDCHGHAVGDAVLQQLAQRWRQCIRDGDLAARYGGDEFVLLIQRATTADDVEPIIQRLREATRRPVDLGAMSLFIDATIGWSTPPADGPWTIDALVAAADRDMYARKRGVLR
jgi:diguanylate cyclase (GGDEF)-like protein